MFFVALPASSRHSGIGGAARSGVIAGHFKVTRTLYRLSSTAPLHVDRAFPIARSESAYELLALQWARDLELQFQLRHSNRPCNRICCACWAVLPGCA